jgi:hypothetical protein
MTFSVDNNISALKAFGAKMGVTANNIAKVASEAFKKSHAMPRPLQCFHPASAIPGSSLTGIPGPPRAKRPSAIRLQDTTYRTLEQAD